jgi:hypothetical protein
LPGGVLTAIISPDAFIRAAPVHFAEPSRLGYVYGFSHNRQREEQLMKTKSKLVLGFIAVALFCLVGWSGKAQSSSRTIWEYKVLTSYGTNDTPPPSLDQFNQMGADGWELVTAVSEDATNTPRHQRRIENLFMRAK